MNADANEPDLTPIWATCTYHDGDLSEYWTKVGEVRSNEDEVVTVDVVRFDTGLTAAPVVQGEPLVRVGGHLLAPRAVQALASYLIEAAATAEGEGDTAWPPRSGLARVIALSHPRRPAR